MRYFILLIFFSALSFSYADTYICNPDEPNNNCPELIDGATSEECLTAGYGYIAETQECDLGTVSCNPDSPEYSPETCSEYQPNLWQRILEDIAGGVGTAAVLGIAAFLAALLLPPVRKYLSKLFSKILTRNKIETPPDAAEAKEKTEGQLYPYEDI